MNETSVDPNAVSISVVATGATLAEAVEKLKASVATLPSSPEVTPTSSSAQAETPTRGRPKGSTNKPKTEGATTAPAVTPPVEAAPAGAESAAAPAAGDKPVTKDEAVAALQAVLKANADPAAGMNDVRTVLSEFKTVEGKKVVKIGDVNPHDFAAVKAAAEKFLADKA